MSMMRRLGWASALMVACATAGSSATTAAGDDLRPRWFGEGVFTTGAYDFFVALSPDQSGLLVSPGNGLGDIYSIPIEALEISR